MKKFGALALAAVLTASSASAYMGFPTPPRGVIDTAIRCSSEGTLMAFLCIVDAFIGMEAGNYK